MSALIPARRLGRAALGSGRKIKCSSFASGQANSVQV